MVVVVVVVRSRSRSYLNVHIVKNKDKGGAEPLYYQVDGPMKRFGATCHLQAAKQQTTRPKMFPEPIGGRADSRIVRSLPPLLPPLPNS